MPVDYLSFVGFAALLTLAPGPDLAVVVSNAVGGGRVRGLATGGGVVTALLIHGAAAAFGVGALLVRSQTAFELLRAAGVAYLVWLGASTLWRARREPEPGPVDPGVASGGTAWRGARQGLVSNLTNPKVLVFYLSVLPQFLDPSAGSTTLGALGLAVTHALLSVAWLALVVALVHRVRTLIARPRVRRGLDAATGTALVGFGVALALDRG